MTLAGSCLALLAALLWTAATGGAVAAPLLRGLRGSERAAWGLAAGLLLQALLFLALLAFHLTPGRPAMLAGSGVLALACLAATRRRGSLPSVSAAAGGAASKIFGFALAVLTAAAVAVFLISSLSEPLWQNDYLAIWGFKGKTIFLSGSLPGRLFHDPQTAWSHPEYPLLLPLWLASLSALTGSWNDHALALFFPLIEAALLLAMSGFLRRRSSAEGAGMAALLTALFFPLFRPASAGTAEIPLAFAFVLLSTALLDLLETGGAAAAGRLALASLLACGIKQEGTLFVAVLAAWLGLAAVRRRGAIPRAAFAALLVPAAFQGLVLRIGRGPLSDRDFDLTYLRLDRAAELLRRLERVFAHLLEGESRLILLSALAVAVYLLAAPRRPSGVLLPPLAGQIALYAAACAFSAFDPIWLARNSFLRISATLFPVLALVIGDRASPIVRAGAGSGEPEKKAETSVRVRRR